MSSRHLVDPELVPLLDVYQPLEMTRESLPASRRERAAMVATLLAAQPPDDIEKAEHLIAGASGAALRVLVYTPRGAKPHGAKPPGAKPPGAAGPLPAYLNLHGGGLVGGSPEQDEMVNRRLAGALGCVVVSPDYRLAPETPYPGPLEDCCAAFDWMVGEAGPPGIDRERIALGGSSAGGCLAAGLALLLRDRARNGGGGVQPVFLFLVFPMLDDRTGSTRPVSPLAGEFIWTAAQNRFGWAAYLNAEPGSEGISAYAAPARAESLAGLPPTWIGCGALDLFIEENLEFTRRLIAAGVPAELHVYPGAYHAFQWVATAGVTQAFAHDSLNAFRRAFASRAE